MMLFNLPILRMSEYLLCLMAMVEAFRRENIFKIVSLTKQRPIFLCRPTEPVELHSLPEELQQSANGLLRMRKAKEELQKIANKLSLLAETREPFLQQRSDSCDLSSKTKGKTQREENSESQGRTQRNIRECLRLAYKRADVDRRLSNPRLPSITNIQSPGMRLQHGLSAKQRKLANLRKVGKKTGYEGADHMKTRAFFRSEVISGWDDWPSPEDF